MVALSLSEDALKHLKELPATVSQIDVPESDFFVYFVYLSGERLYTAVDMTL
jgi:cyanate lyase